MLQRTFWTTAIASLFWALTATMNSQAADPWSLTVKNIYCDDEEDGDPDDEVIAIVVVKQEGERPRYFKFPNQDHPARQLDRVKLKKPINLHGKKYDSVYAWNAQEVKPTHGIYTSNQEGVTWVKEIPDNSETFLYLYEVDDASWVANLSNSIASTAVDGAALALGADPETAASAGVAGEILSKELSEVFTNTDGAQLLGSFRMVTTPQEIQVHRGVHANEVFLEGNNNKGFNIRFRYNNEDPNYMMVIYTDDQDPQTQDQVRNVVIR